MKPARRHFTLLEPLEARIAPALTVFNPLPDLFVGPGKTGAEVDLTRLFDPFVTDNGHTIVTLTTNFDADPNTAGIQPSAPIVIELFDDQAPLTVQNFLSYLTNPDPKTNYVGTFFHRAIAGFVLQGGGFDVIDPDTHIPTAFNIHNEFDGVNRSNLEGTIAMAKNAFDPNTATSEWFINLGNNSTNLDNQNGGFTVFARVLSGLNVAKAIVLLPKLTATSTPVQNYDANPDNNVNTPPPAATTDNLVTVTGYTITKPPSGNVSGVTYSFNPAVDVVDAGTGAPSDLVTGSVIGSTLQLNYKAHAAGVVRVTVRGSDGEGSTADTFTINLQPNLIASIAQDPFQDILVTGDSKVTPIAITNTGGGWATGKVDIKIYISEVRFTGLDANNNRLGADPFGVLLQPSADVLVQEFTDEMIDIAGGATQMLNKTVDLKNFALKSGGYYRLLVQVTPADGAINERFSDDNLSLDSKTHGWENAFGTFSTTYQTPEGAFRLERANATLSYAEPDGDVVSFSMGSGGAGQVVVDAALVDLSIIKARPREVLAATILSSPASGGGDLDLRNVELAQFMDRVDLSKTTLTGSFSAPAGVRVLRLGDVSGGGTLTIGPYAVSTFGKPALGFQSVQDFSIESLVGIRAIRAFEWLETGGDASSITAPTLGSLEITGRAGTSTAPALRGDFEANVSLRGSYSLGAVKIAGFLRDATIATTGDVGRVVVGGIDHANIFVGVTERPDARNDFARPHFLGAFVVQGVAGSVETFIDSDVAAARIGSVIVKRIDEDSRDTRFGIVADAIGSYNRSNVFLAKAKSNSQAFDRLGSYAVRIF